MGFRDAAGAESKRERVIVVETVALVRDTLGLA